MSVKTKRDTETPGQRWTWVEASVWTDGMLAALDNGVKGGKWYSLIDKVYRATTLQAAWEKVQSKQGAAGVDRITVERYTGRAPDYLAELQQALQSRTYQPQAVRRVEIPKEPGKTRPLGIPTVQDRVVQGAVKSVIEPIFEQEFLPTSYGFRPGRGCKAALREVDQALKAGYTWVVDADIQGYFDNISHPRLMARLAERVADRGVLDLIEAFLKQEIMAEMASWTPTRGTPQGAVISPLLANIYLHPLDRLLTEAGYRMVRYADDFVILCQSREAADQALERVRYWMAENELTLHPDKTHVGNCMEAGQGFEFLGYRFETGQRTVRKKSLKKLREAIRQRTPRQAGKSLKSVIEQLNPVLRGWFGYFKHANKSTFRKVDGFVRRRLRRILLAYRHKPGDGCGEAHRKWPNAYFATQGLFTMQTAYAQASQSR